MYTVSGSSSTSMTSSRRSLEKKMPALRFSTRAYNSVEWAHLRKDRYQPGRCGYRPASRRPSRNRIRHLTLGVTTISMRSSTKDSIDLRSRLHFLWRLQNHCLPPLESMALSEPGNCARGKIHTTSLMVTLRSLIGSADGIDVAAGSSGISSKAPANMRSAASITSLYRLSAARAWATVAP